MTGKKIYLAAQTVLCVLIVLLLSMAAVRIFREGSKRKAEHPLESIYTAEGVADGFAPVAPLLFAGIGMAAAGLILGAKDEKAETGVKDPYAERDLIVSRVREAGAEMRQEKKRQKGIRAGGWTAFCLCMVPVLLYFTKGAHFPGQDPEAMFAALTAGVFPWIGAGMACLVIAGLLEEKSVVREIAAAKQQMKAEREDGSGAAAGASGAGIQVKQKSRSVLQGAVIAAAVLFIILGIRNGGMQDVLIKAINICTECIGLG